MKYSRYQVFEAVKSTRCSTCLKHCIAFFIKRISRALIGRELKGDESTDHGKDMMMLQCTSHSLARANPGETLTKIDVKNCQCYCGSWFPLRF